MSAKKKTKLIAVIIINILLIISSTAYAGNSASMPSKISNNKISRSNIILEGIPRREIISVSRSLPAKNRLNIRYVPCGELINLEKTYRGKTITWKSGNPRILSINNKTGKAFGRNIGSTYVYGYNGKKRLFKMKSSVMLTSMTIDTPIDLPVKQKSNLTVKDTRGRYVPATIRSSNSKVIRITKNRKKFDVTALKKGSAVITVSYRGLYKKYTIYSCQSESITPYPNRIVYKPAIYIYNAPDEEVNVKIGTENMDVTVSYPQYPSDGWTVRQSEDGGRLSYEGKNYRYLYYEGELKEDVDWDMKTGFCVKSEDTAAFLEEKLKTLGLNEDEIREFVVYWLPLMQKNAYNLISFTSKQYDELVPLKINPAPEQTIRVYMTYKPLEEPVEVKPQELETIERDPDKYTAVEWGGSIL